MGNTQTAEPVLQIRRLTKNFSGTLALDHVSMDIWPGEIHALLGENGAGKSTLIKILDGMYTCTAGDFTLKGKPYHFSDGKLPISVIHQDLGVVDDLTVIENIAVVSGFVKKGPLISWRATREKAAKILEFMGCDISLDSRVGELPSAERSMVAISRALAVKSDILILDEPTATLPQNDVEKLFEILDRLRKQGMAIIYVSHRLDEVFRIADRVTVLRNGRNISTKPISEVTKEQLIFDIVGKKTEDVFAAPVSDEGREVALEVRNLCCDFVRNVDFDLHNGEILTLFGLRGAGHHEVGRALYGCIRPQSMSVKLAGVPIRIRNCDDALRQGIGFLSSKRLEESLAPLFTVRENIFFNPVANGKKPLGFIRANEERLQAQEVVERFTVKPATTENLVGTLSGGNQQKAVLARIFETDPQVFIMEEPTIGVDIGAKADIYKKMNEAIAMGKTIILISSDIEDVSRISHRVLVFSRGRICQELRGDDISVETLTRYAAC